MASASQFFWRTLSAVAFFAGSAVAGFAIPTISQQVSPAELHVGDDAIITITIHNGTVNAVTLPPVDGLETVGTQTGNNLTYSNGAFSSSTSYIFDVSIRQSGEIAIPAFDVMTTDGQVLHVKPMKLHVQDNGALPPSNVIAVPVPVPNQTTSAVAISNGPVVMPPTNAAPTAPAPNPENPAASTTPGINAPRDPDGGPAKVFITITPQTTDAYVGQSIPMEIDFYIRMDVNWDQNSLPTIKGSDFLMNNFTTRGRIGIGLLENLQYMRESWSTAISAPKSGDFPLSMERDTYWVKSTSNANPNSIFGGFFGQRRTPAHEFITSNLLTMHVHELPAEGRPDHFTGVIGQLRITGEASPSLVAVGEPVKLHFTVSGEGNFDYVRSPALRDDPAWKAYVPSSKISYLNESHTNALKTFEQSVIPQKNGVIPLPVASFSYFDPGIKQYITVPIALPDITVTGSTTAIATALPDGATDSTTVDVTPKATDFLPNRIDIGSTRKNLAPVYRQPWFWAVQTGLVALPLVAVLILWIRRRSTRDEGQAERALRQQSQQQEENAMFEAARRGDPVAFFIAARHAIQMQLGAQWNLKPEAITLREIRVRDPHLAETLEPLFTQADEVIYSGKASPNLDLAQWEQRIRAELLQPQPA